MKSQVLLASAVLALFFGAGAAQAKIVNVTVVGVIGEQNADDSSLFGGGSLTGDDVIVRYVFDTSLGHSDPVPHGKNRIGGSLFNTTSPALGATITVNGDTVSLGGGEFGVIAETSDKTASFHNYEADESDSRYVYSYVTAAPHALPASITKALDYMVKPSDDAFGYFQFDNTFASFAPTSVTVGVPEPATWAMMLLGFAALGMAGRKTVRRAV